MNNGENKKRTDNWVFNNNILIIVSLCVALIVWVVVAMTVDRDIDKVFASVPVNIKLNAEAFADSGFNPVSANISNVSVKVEGDRTALTQLRAEDLVATVRPSIAVTEPDTYMLTLVPASTELDSRLITKIEYTPAEVMVRVDRLMSKTLKVEPIIRGLVMPDAYVQGAQTITPSQITVNGPKAEIDKIAKCVIRKDFSAPLEKTFVDDLPLMLLDARGDEIDIKEKNITINYDEARLVIEMLKRTGLMLNVEFTNIPRNFPIDSLTFLRNADFLEVAAPVDMVGRDDEIIVGYIDMRTIDKQNNTFTFPVEVPSTYQNLDNLTEVRVRFDSAGWEEANFTADGITLLNIPDQYDVKISGGAVHNVKFTGRRDIIDEMTGEDIVMEINLADREISEGQFQWPVKISAPTKGLVWAVGEYFAIVEITEKTE